jgi:cytoskeletal protein CcmA (bactofilin family)
MAEPAACIISHAIQVKGSLSGSGDLIVQGRMEGQVSLQAHVTVEENGVIVANVETQELTVNGQMNGNTEATERISISNTALYVGDLKAPRIVLEDGARFRGNIEMDVPLPKGV